MAGGYALGENAAMGVCREVLLWRQRSKRFSAHEALVQQKRLGIDLAASPSLCACEIFAEYLEMGPGHLCGSAPYMPGGAGQTLEPSQQRVLQCRLECRQKARAWPTFREASTPYNMGLVRSWAWEGCL